MKYVNYLHQLLRLNISRIKHQSRIKLIKHTVVTGLSFALHQTHCLSRHEF